MLGLPSWLVKRGYGTFVTLEFGEPRLKISEPTLSRVLIDGAPPGAMRRYAIVRGQWHLWIYCCRWSLALDGTALADDESDDVTMMRALYVLNGQALTGVTVDPSDGSTRFAFDLGCVLTTTPAPADVYGAEPVEQWMLSQPSGDQLAVRSDGRYAIGTDPSDSDDLLWAPIPPAG